MTCEEIIGLSKKKDFLSTPKAKQKRVSQKEQLGYKYAAVLF